MNQKYGLPNGNHKYHNPMILQNISKTTNQWALGNTKTSQGYLLKSQIRNGLLCELPETQLEKLFHSMETVYLASGEYIFQPDDFVQHIYFPETAVVSEFQILEDGKTNEVIMTGNEGAIGINSIFYAHPSPNWTQVLISGKALRMDAEICRREMNSLPNFRAGFYEYLNKYIAQITQRVICNNHHSVEERLCCWLLMIHDRCGSDTLSLTQEQIAHFLGVHRPSITLITQSLREKAIIDYVRGKIFILDRYKLEYASCSCYSPAKFI